MIFSFHNILLMLVLFFSLFTTILFLLTFLENGKENKKIKKIPKISVIIPAYNESKNILKSIRSVLKSDYPKKKLEIIIVDDGSTDDTFSQAKKMESENVKVFTKKHGGKAKAVNFGIKKASGEILMILDADTFPEKKCFKKIIGYFDDPEVMAALPLIKIWKPKNLIEKCQVVEYTIMGLIKRSFSFMGSMSCTPAGAFIRRSFLKKYGGFATDTLTEDFEMGLRIKSKKYKIIQSLESQVYTVVPNKIRKLIRQRVRWSFGTLENIKKYKFMINPKYGDLGVFFLPINLIAIGLVSFIFIYYTIKSIFEFIENIRLWSLIGFDIFSKMDFDLKISFLRLLSDEKNLLILLATLTAFLMYEVSRRAVKENFRVEYIFYLLIYGWIMGLSQLISLVYFIFGKKPRW